MKTNIIGQATPEQIKAWKDQHQEGLFAIKVQGHIAYFREPDIQDMNAAGAVTDKDNVMDYFIVLARDTYVGGSRELFEGHRKLVLDFIATYRPKVEGKKGELVNL